MVKSILIVGVGGQGTLLTSRVVGNALTSAGYDVKISEIHGMAQRGGSVMSHVRVSKEDDLGVLIPSGEAHIIIGFEPLETLRMARQYAGPNTMIVYDPRPIYPLGVLQGNQSYPTVDEINAEINAITSEAHAISAADIALEIGDTKAANVVLLGAFSRLPGAPLNTEELSAILAQRFSGKVLEMNQKAFAKGCSAMDAKGGTV